MPLMLLAVFASCNRDRDFPDFDYQAVYFAYQHPIRTITLGEDLSVDNTFDNQHKFQIYAAFGGGYKARHDINVNIAVDNSLLSDGTMFRIRGNSSVPAFAVFKMPEKYYSFSANSITIPKGEVAGGVPVQLTDAFFADPDAVKRNYAIPVRITGANVDSVLSAKNFTLYMVKFVNTWHGNYLRRGTDAMTGDVNKSVNRHAQYVEYDQVNMLSTKTIDELEFPVVFQDNSNNSFTCTLLLKFDNSGNCTITSNTTGFTASGTGSFIKRGEKNSWGGKDRDALYLNYNITYNGVTVGAAPNVRLISGSIATKDTLVMRDRAVKMEEFEPAG